MCITAWQCAPPPSLPGPVHSRNMHPSPPPTHTQRAQRQGATVLQQSSPQAQTALETRGNPAKTLAGGHGLSSAQYASINHRGCPLNTAPSGRMLSSTYPCQAPCTLGTLPAVCSRRQASLGAATTLPRTVPRDGRQVGLNTSTSGVPSQTPHKTPLKLGNSKTGQVLQPQ